MIVSSISVETYVAFFSIFQATICVSEVGTLTDAIVCRVVVLKDELIGKRSHTARGIVMKATSVSPIIWQVGLLYGRNGVYCKVRSAVRVDTHSVAGTAELRGVTRTLHIAIRLWGRFGSVLKVIAAETLVGIFNGCHAKPERCAVTDTPLNSHIIGVLELVGEYSTIGVVYPASFVIPTPW